MSRPTSLAGRIPSWPRAETEEYDVVREVLASGRWGSSVGDQTRAFEQEFAAFHEAAHGLAIANGTLAIMAALVALDLPEGAEVIVPSYTFFATAAAPLAAGLVPVFCDTGPGDHLMDPSRLDALVTEHTAAIVPVHMGGALCDMDAVMAIARRHGLRVVEDAAQATGARYLGRGLPVGDVATFSFQNSKNITAGEGGALVTNDRELAGRLFSVINVGRRQGGGWYEHPFFGMNLRLSELQSAVLRRQLARHPALQQAREEGATHLRARLGRVEGLELPAPPAAGSVHGQHLFIMRFPGITPAARDGLVERLHAVGLEGASSGYVPLHRLPSLLAKRQRFLEVHHRTLPAEDCRETERVASETVWLPQQVLLADHDVLDEVADTIESAWAHVCGVAS